MPPWPKPCRRVPVRWSAIDDEPKSPARAGAHASPDAGWPKEAKRPKLARCAASTAYRGRPRQPRIRIMRRWVFAFLLLVVPFQMVWGSAAPYCAHEAGASAKKHFGHHEHQHQAGDIVTAIDNGADSTGAFHADCESCHLGCAALMPSPSAAVAALPLGNTIARPEPRYASPIPAGPHRPDRAAPAPAARFGGGVVVFSIED